MIDALFGSKTRVKLLHLFLNNPGKAFYVREITRLIDEQINSVRRELSNMLEVGIIGSSSTDNRLYYEVNQRYEHYLPFRSMFADQKAPPVSESKSDSALPWLKYLREIKGVRLAVIAGVLVSGSASNIDLLLVGDASEKKVTALVGIIEESVGRELSYTVMKYDEFYYRLSVHDKFITTILANKHSVLLDSDDILNA